LRAVRVGRGRFAVLAALAGAAVLPVVPAEAADEPEAPELIAFVSDRWSGEKTDIGLMAADGSAPTRFTYELGSEGPPTWSPDGGHLAYVGGTGALEPFPGFFVDRGRSIISFDGASRHEVASSSGGLPGGPSTVYDNPVWMPSGELSYSRTDRLGLGAVDPPFSSMVTPGFTVPELPEPHELLTFPTSWAWSPDGTRIAVDFDGDVYVGTSGADDPVVIEGAGAPDWSPDGLSIAYSAGGDLFTIPAAGGPPVPITSGAGVDTEPTWSADGTRLAFATDRDGDWEIYAVAADGTTPPVNLTNAPDSDERSPAWSGPCPEGCIDLQVPSTPPDRPFLAPANPQGSSLPYLIVPRDTGTAPQSFEITVSSTGETTTATSYVFSLPFSDFPVAGGSFTVTLTASNQAGTSEPYVREEFLGCDQVHRAQLTDVPTWAEDPAEWLVGSGVMAGFGGGTFRPLAPVTRAQVARVLHRLANSPDVDGLPPNGFDDVPAWADDAVTWIVDAGAMAGFPDGFRPNRPMGRGAVAQTLHHLAGSPDVSGLPANTFTDVPDRLDDAVTWIVGTGLAAGYPDQTFRPSRPLTRGALARILYADTCTPPG
jgi:hypothetical protein